MKQRKEIVEVLKKCQGDITVASTILEMTTDDLIEFIEQDEGLAPFYKPEIDRALSSEMEEVSRTVENTPLENALAKAVVSSNLSLLGKELISAGHDASIIERLDKIGGFEKNAGVFLASSLNLMYKMIVDSGLSLYEHLDFIKLKLTDKNIPAAERMAWQKAYNTTVDQLGKNYDRVLTGTQVLAKLAPGESKKATNKKPGFSPI